MATLFVNIINSRCGECHKRADPHETTHRTQHAGGGPAGCGAVYDAVSTNYVSSSPQFYDQIRDLRPDLPFVEP